jgi:hypothetical protein
MSNTADDEELLPLVPPPGSNSAQAQGCSCPVMDNNHGLGVRYSPDSAEAQYWISEGCPLHALPAAPTAEEPSDSDELQGHPV